YSPTEWSDKGVVRPQCENWVGHTPCSRLAVLPRPTQEIVMLILPQRPGKDTCDGLTRRDLLRVGGSAMIGLTLANLLRFGKAHAAEGAGGTTEAVGGTGWGKAKSIIMIYLQGGPSHLDLWDPKDNVPDKVRSVFKAIPTKTAGVNVTEILPKFAQITDKVT